MRYVFGSLTEGDVRVLADDRYGAKPYGFLTEECREWDRRLRLPEINSGFEPVYWSQGQTLTKIEEDENGCFVDWDGEGAIPLTFAADLEREGNYRVTVELWAEEAVEEAMLFLGRRRLALLRDLPKGTRLQEQFVTNICPIIPRGQEDAEEDTTLDVTVIGKGLRLGMVDAAPWEGKTLYIAGDSTVTDQSAEYPYLPGSSYCGWGQMLSAYLGCRMAVSNHAHSGLTTESFRSEGHYQILLDRILPGDVCLFQFGHNDQKLDFLKAEEGYRENLLRYIREIREKGACPVLVTPLARNSWRGDDGSYNDLLEPYETACQKIAKETGVPLLNLHQMSKAFILEHGCEDAKRFFYPSDYTHSNDYGAYRFAEFIAKELVRCGIVEDVQAGEWNPPAKLPRLSVPAEFAGMKNPAEQPLFENLERPGDLLTRAEALEFVIAAMRFFPTNVYNDMFTDVIGHETYAGSVECAWQNGLILPEMVRDQKIFPQELVTGGEFIRILLNGYKSRKPLPQPKEGQDWADILADAFCVLQEGFSKEEPLTRALAADICQQFRI
ncbi:MAG: rhamnogalacturonan acetylesterase [Eubacteriales bacterium]|nr:rhamnogalacturonan acetylesterase [Eubacteriales bacterium]